jgi:hypothetical protein
MRSLLLVAALAPPAHAGPLGVGASLGLTQSKADSSADPDHTLAIFGRLALNPRLAAQLELAKLDTTDRGLNNVDVRSLGGVVVLDLGTGRFVPILLAGVGLDRASESYGEIDAHHIEAGIGLEYRSPSGFTLGADARIGDRTIDSDTTIVPLACCTDLWSQPALAGGEYRSLRVALGVRF